MGGGCDQDPVTRVPARQPRPLFRLDQLPHLLLHQLPVALAWEEGPAVQRPVLMAGMMRQISKCAAPSKPPPLLANRLWLFRTRWLLSRTAQGCRPLQSLHNQPTKAAELEHLGSLSFTRPHPCFFSHEAWHIHKPALPVSAAVCSTKETSYDTVQSAF